MKAEIYRTSNYGEDSKIININTLEEIIDICKKEKSSIIISIPTECDTDWCDIKLEIYDDRRE